MAKRILILGATSDIAVALARRYAAEKPIIGAVGRSAQALAVVAQDLLARGAREVPVLPHDLSEVSPSVFEGWLDELGGCDLLILAYGEMPEQERVEQELSVQQQMLRTNFTSACGWLQLAANAMVEGGGGQLVVLSSVAADRARKPNFGYGASKAGLAFYAEGLGLKLASSGVRVCVVKPGQTRTRMTAHLETTGALWAEPEAVALAVARAVEKNRRVVYAPGFWRWIMLIIRSIPHFLFRRLNF